MYDIIFMSYEESHVDKHWDIVKKKFWQRRSHGVLGLSADIKSVRMVPQKCIML